MIRTVRAPRLGEGVEELAIGKILVSLGDQVEENWNLMELESDKVVSNLSSPASGRVMEIFVSEGDQVQVGDPLIKLETDVPALDSAPPLREKDSPPLPQNSAPLFRNSSVQSHGALSAKAETGTKTTFLSPLARKLIRAHGLDPAKIRGTGLGGRIMKQDILDYLEQTSKHNVEENPEVERKPSLVPHSISRKRIAERMLRSIHNSAPVLTVMEADLSAVLQHRLARKEAYAREGVRLTLTGYFIHAVARSLREHPLVNASWTDEGMVYHEDIHIGMAVALGTEGLIVPVIRQADRLSLRDLALRIEDLAFRARNRTLAVDEVRGATFSVTNHGTGGSLFATPVIVEGHTGILGIGAMQKRPVVVQTTDGSDAIAVRPLVYLSFVFDHRVMDGEGADSFLKSVKDHLEHWVET